MKERSPGRVPEDVAEKVRKIERKKLPYDTRKMSRALNNLAPLVYETLAEDRGAVDSRRYHEGLEMEIEQRDPFEDKEKTYADACSTLRRQGKSMKDVATALLLRNERVSTARSLGTMTQTQYEQALGKLITGLSDFYPGAKRANKGR